ncbi:hypothetical protein K474DRAFT_1707755 [Panus rudis PR-1116 ss-1]|nr:hypothetical protein K474DRAFT_1707755 [Panus rudis PR-1116 ss-1]
MRRRFDINKFLTRFFDDPLAFRSMQAETGALISGSMALQFLDRSFYPESDLDLYAEQKNSKQIEKWLIEAGYMFQPQKHQPPEFRVAILTNSLDRLANYESDITGVDRWGDPPKVQLILTYLVPWAVISEFHSTVVMNAISYRAAYSLYPLATFDERKALVNMYTDLDERKQEALEKYKQRGWEMIEYRDERKYPEYTLLFGPRMLDDHRIWTMSLDTTGIPSRNLFKHPAKEDQWDPRKHLFKHPADRTYGIQSKQAVL